MTAPTSSSSEHSLAHYRSEFPIFRERIYLNSCSLGALSKRAEQSVARHLRTWHSRGASAWYDVWWEALDDLRAGYAGIIQAQPGEIALHPSVSTATAVLSSALDYTDRPRIVTTALDFPTVPYQWLAKHSQGIEVVIVESPDGITVPPETIAAAVDDRTALVATSHVYFATGAIQDIETVAKVAHECGAFCFVDAYQSVGQIPIDVHSTEVDFLCAGGLKWLLGGPGIVFLYVRQDLVEQLVPNQTGWFANERQFEFDPRAINWHTDARRYEQGTPSLLSVFAQLGGLEIIKEIGVPAIREVVLELTNDLIERAQEAGLHPKTSARREDRAAIVMLPSNDPHGQVRQLADARIIADARHGHVRLSPFFYNLKEDNVAAIEVLER
jgi:kynureninase